MSKRVINKLALSSIILLLCILLLLSNYIKYNSNKPANKAGQGVCIIVIDPGHGGTDGGTVGASGRYEKDFTLSLSKKVYDILKDEDKIEVHMTRYDDSTLSTVDRARPRLANDLGADLYISIHGNYFDEADVSGTETYYYDKESKSFAEIIHKHVINATGFKDRGVKKGNFYVLKETNMLATLLEIGFLSNLQEEGKMFEDEFQNSVAKAICSGVKEYLGLEKSNK